MVSRLSSNVDAHVDNYLLMLCSMPLTIIVRLVFNIKTICYEQHDMFINYTLSSSQFILCYVFGHFASIIAIIIIYS